MYTFQMLRYCNSDLSFVHKIVTMFTLYCELWIPIMPLGKETLLMAIHNIKSFAVNLEGFLCLRLNQ